MSDSLDPRLEDLNGRFRANGDLVKQLRNSRGMTQEQLAKLAKCSPTTIANIESGRRRALAATLSKVSKVFGQPFQAILADHAYAQYRDAPQRSETPADLKLAAVELSTPFEKFDETADLRQVAIDLARVLSTKVKKIYIVCVTEGSTIIQIRIPAFELETLFERVTMGTLKIRYPVSAVYFDNTFRIPFALLPIVSDFRFKIGYPIDGMVRMEKRQPIGSRRFSQ